MYKNIIIVFLFLIVPLFWVQNVYAQNLDINLLKAINKNHSDWADKAAIRNDFIVYPVCALTPIAIAAVGLINKDAAIFNKSVPIALSLLSTSLFATALKYGINRDRPYTSVPGLITLKDQKTPSFPSGHTSNIFALATSLSYAFPKWYIIAPAYLYAGAIAYSRMYMGVHYPSDVLAVMILGTGLAMLVHKVDKSGRIRLNINFSQ